MVGLKELRVGNLVQTSAIIELNAWHLYLIETKRWVPRGIPLTEEWLLKAGFVDTEGIGVFVNGRFDLEKLTADSEEWEFCVFENETGATVKHVHQLQNLYFALTGQELTFDNITSS